ncbi:MAG: TerD family protein [Rhodospirillales bacterium]|nr:TerD family protein [Rhodospirillales bacterium]MCB9996148.1 TerD family protein [Rhodospirillales bacterium]
MDDMENDDLSNFREDDDDRIKPIDIGGDPLYAGNPVPQPENPLPPLPEETREVAENPVPEDIPAGEPEKPFLQDEPAPLATGGDREPFYIKAGEYIDLVEKVPTLKRIVIGAGWDQLSPEADLVDVDLSLFLCDKTDKTRIDEDFIFYNNPKACDGAVRHLSDSRTGAGAGDDEEVFLDLNGVPFDVIKIVCVLSIYDPEIKGHNFNMVKNIYMRIVNKDDGEEVFRYAPPEDKLKGASTAVVLGTLIREGPRWIYEAAAEVTGAGLAKVATDYGLIIKELQSTLDVDDDAL